MVDNTIKVRGLPYNLFQIVKERLSAPNPAYINALKYSKNQWAVNKMPKKVRSWGKDGKWLTIPRGYYFEFRMLLEHNNIEYTISKTPVSA